MADFELLVQYRTENLEAGIDAVQCVTKYYGLGYHDIVLHPSNSF